MNLDSFTGSGSTASRRKFWDQVREAVLALQKLEGRNISIDVHEGQGSIINALSRTGGGCPILTNVTFDSVVFDGICRIRFSTPNGSYHVDDVSFNEERAISAFGPVEGVECANSQDDSPGDYQLSDYADGTTDCSGSPTTVTDSTIVIVFRVSGLWRVIALSNMSNGVTAVMFYGGPQSSVSDPFTNLCVGTATNALTLPDPTIWALVGIGSPLTGVASGGTATLA